MTAAAGVLSVLLLLALQIPGQALPHKEVSGPLNSSIALPTDINVPVKEVIWTHTSNGKESKMIKIRNGTLISRPGDRYNPDINGTYLVISNLAENDSGVYKVEVTLPNGTLLKQTFTITISEDNNRILTIVLSVVAVVVVVGAVMAVLVWKCWKRSSETSEDTSYSGVASSDRLERTRPSHRTSNSSL